MVPMKQKQRTLNVAQARVLRVLSWGGMVGERRIAETAGLRRIETRRAVADLDARFMVRSVGWSAGGDRFEITDSGRIALAAAHPRYGALPSDPLRATGNVRPVRNVLSRAWIRLR